ncbi:MAG: alpha/beta fold hydrolase [Nocardioides sp.]
MQTSTVTAPDGTALHIEELGTGRPVLLLQGLGYASWAWRLQAPAVATVGRAVLLDNRGSGRSGKPAGPYTVAQLADDAAAVLDGLGAGPALVVGASMGGYVAMTLALRRPDLVRGLVLVATSAGGPEAERVPEETARAWRAAADLPAPAFARETMPLSFAPGWTEEHPARFEQWLAARLEDPTPPEAWRAQYDACERHLDQGLPEGDIDLPTYVVHGTADRVVPYGNAELVRKRIPRAEVVTMNGCGHLCWLERPHVVNRLLVAAAAAC